MSNNYIMIDNKRIELPDELVGNFKKQLGIPEPKQVKVYRFRAAKSVDTPHLYLLGSVNYPGPAWDVWDGKGSENGSNMQIGCYSKDEVQQIIAGLQDLIKD